PDRRLRRDVLLLGRSKLAPRGIELRLRRLHALSALLGREPRPLKPERVERLPGPLERALRRRDGRRRLRLPRQVVGGADLTGAEPRDQRGLPLLRREPLPLQRRRRL